MNGRGMFVSGAAAGAVLVVVWLRPTPGVLLTWLALAVAFHVIWCVGRLPGR